MSDELVTIASYEFVAQAEIAQMFLRENGIDAFLRDQSIIAMDWLLGNAIGYVKLQVPQSQIETARELLAAFKEDSAGNNKDGSPPSRVCSSCGLALGDITDTCPACSGANEDVAPVDLDEDAEPSDTQEEDAFEEDEDRHSIMSQVRSLKKPIFWLVLFPILFVLAMAAAELLKNLISWL
jgi:hypothetical protein